MTLILNRPAQATEAFSGTSDKYLFLPTKEIVTHLGGHGFEPFSQKVVKTRDVERRGYAKHVVMLRHPDLTRAGRVIGDAVPQVGILNAHDGASSLRVFFGMYRLVCLNGLVVGSTWDDLAYQHRGNGHTLDEILADVYGLVSRAGAVADRVSAMQSVTLTRSQQEEFARQAALLRWEEGQAPFTVDGLLRPRRQEDHGTDVWSLMNVVQENLIKGRFTYNPLKRRSNKVRGVNSVNTDLDINRKLWTLAEALAA